MSHTVKSIANVIPEQGIDVVKDVIASFSCKYNPEIDGYLRNRAIDFTQKSMSVSHLVFDTCSGLCVGCFALTHKPVTFNAATLSGTQRKRIEGFAKLNVETGTYTVSAFLIAQLGKNYLAKNGELNSGVALLDLAKDELHVCRKCGKTTHYPTNELGPRSFIAEYRKGCANLRELGRDVTLDESVLCRRCVSAEQLKLPRFATVRCRPEKTGDRVEFVTTGRNNTDWWTVAPIGHRYWVNAKYIDAHGNILGDNVCIRLRPDLRD